MKNIGLYTIIIALSIPIVGELAYILYMLINNLLICYKYRTYRGYGTIESVIDALKSTFDGGYFSIDYEWVWIIGINGIILGLIIGIISAYYLRLMKKSISNNKSA